DRKRVRECSKTMREAVQQSDLSIALVVLRFRFQSFEKEQSLRFEVAGHKNEFFEETEGNNAGSFENWLNTLRLSWFFRHLKSDGFLIETQGTLCVIDESELDQIAAQFDFAELNLRFFSRLQPSVIRFARRSKKPIDSITTGAFSPDPLEI
ncbi:hypothetical protein PFISCL1PPCAC_17960, partial [Pristionchus fissidentatus]